jgi:hypothetical protein
MNGSGFRHGGGSRARYGAPERKTQKMQVGQGVTYMRYAGLFGSKA